MKLIQGKAVDMVLFVIVAIMGGIHAADPNVVTCPEIAEGCPTVCGTPDSKETFMCVLQEDNSKSSATATCICNDKIGGEGHTETDDKARLVCKANPNAQCEKCPESLNLVLYSCSESLPTGEIYGNQYCGCAKEGTQPAKVVPYTGTDAEQSRGRRGKFPPILAQLLKALQQVRSRFSGRQ